VGAFVAAAATSPGGGLSSAQRGRVREGESEISSPSTFDLVLQPAEAMKWETHDTAEFELHTSEEGYMISRESGDNFYGSWNSTK
jgi:hypothetical protein